MKFTVGRDALGEAVAFVSRALPSRPVLPLLSGMLIEASAGRLTLSCFDYEVSARASVDADVGTPGSALVPGRLLAEITRSLPDRPADFAADAGVISLTCGRAEFGLVCLPLEDYPALPDSPEPVGALDSGLLAAAVAQVAPAASRDDTLPMLTAVCLDITGDVMTLAATDRYRLAARDVSFAPAEPGRRALALVPAKIMVEAARTFQPGVPVTLAFGTDGGQRDGGQRDGGQADGGQADGGQPGGGQPGGGQRGGGQRGGLAADDQPRPAEGLISFDSGDRRLTARLIGGEFIRYRNRFGDDFACRAELPAGPVIEAVRRAALVAERAGPVRMSFAVDQVVIEAHAEGRARAAETVGAEFSGDQPVISFNPHYLLDGLTAAAASRQGPAAESEAREPGEASDPGEPGETGEPGERGEPSRPGTTVQRGERVAAGAENGRIRLQFNTPAKPALITWTADSERDGVPAFRYLLVPLRVPGRS
jgi:DNA polymerase-3 subunit beta